MGKILTLVAATLLLAAFSPIQAQAPADAAKKDGAGAQTTPPASAPTDAAKAKEPKTKSDAKVEPEKAKPRVHTAKKPRKHVRARSRARRVARHHGWRRVWVYRAHDRHGDRHYHLVWRKFGGYFARRGDCRCARWGRSHL